MRLALLLLLLSTPASAMDFRPKESAALRAARDSLEKCIGGRGGVVRAPESRGRARPASPALTAPVPTGVVHRPAGWEQGPRQSISPHRAGADPLSRERATYPKNEYRRKHWHWLAAGAVVGLAAGVIACSNRGHDRTVVIAEPPSDDDDDKGRKGGKR